MEKNKEIKTEQEMLIDIDTGETINWAGTKLELQEFLKQNPKVVEITEQEVLEKAWKKESKDIYMHIDSDTYPHKIDDFWKSIAYNCEWQLKSKDDGVAHWKYMGYKDSTPHVPAGPAPCTCNIVYNPKYLEQLPELLEKRIATKHKLTSILLNVKGVKEGIINSELRIKTSFNERLDKNDAKYSNAEKRRVELEKVLKADELLIASKDRLDALEIKLALIERDDIQEKLQERYLFKEIDIYLATLDIEEKKLENLP